MAASRCVRYRWSPDGSCYRRRWDERRNAAPRQRMETGDDPHDPPRLGNACILPLAAEIKAGVLTAQPFGSGRLFRAVRGRTVPDWAKEFAGSWAQFFLKYLLGDERVTAVIPGTLNPAHMADNLGAMRGRLPDPDPRNRMGAFVDSL